VTRIASIDGVVTPAEHAVVSAYDRGFLYGDGVFESMRVYGGRPFAVDDHIARLVRSATALRIPLPVPPAAVGREIDAAIAASGEKEAYVRVAITRGAMQSPALVPREPLVATRVIFVEPVHVDRAVYVDGIRVVTLGWPRFVEPAGPAAAKVIPYLTSYLALEEARAREADDAVFVEGPLVREATTSNVFVVEPSGDLVTPPDGRGVLAGITRAHVLDLALTLGRRCALRSLTRAELLAAKEVFLTSSIREVAPVVAVDGARIGSGSPGETTRLLHRALRLRAGASGSAPWE
jgi:branched-chain amino acid aminotransferase